MFGQQNSKRACHRQCYSFSVFPVVLVLHFAPPTGQIHPKLVDFRKFFVYFSTKKRRVRPLPAVATGFLSLNAATGK